jgi:hypothetical protein
MLRNEDAGVRSPTVLKKTTMLEKRGSGMIVYNGMRIDFSDAVREHAQIGISDTKLNERSIYGFRNQYIGKLSELVVSQFLTHHRIDHRMVGHEVRDYDIRVGDVSLDVKSISRKRYCQLDYEHGIPQAQMFSNCDAYIFVSVLMQDERPMYAQLMGWEYKKDFWDNCEMVAKGQVNQVGLPHRLDNGVCLYSSLRNMSELVYKLSDYLKGKRI